MIKHCTYCKFKGFSEDEVPCNKCEDNSEFVDTTDLDSVLLINDYQEKAMRTASEQTVNQLVLNGALGLCGESGEVADAIKKHLFQGHELDVKHIAEELGDVCWYIAILARGIGYNLQDIIDMNVEKLKKRYPNGFESDRSINRKDDN